MNMWVILWLMLPFETPHDASRRIAADFMSFGLPTHLGPITGEEGMAAVFEELLGRELGAAKTGGQTSVAGSVVRVGAWYRLDAALVAGRDHIASRTAFVPIQRVRAGSTAIELLACTNPCPRVVKCVLEVTGAGTVRPRPSESLVVDSEGRSLRARPVQPGNGEVLQVGRSTTLLILHFEGLPRPGRARQIRFHLGDVVAVFAAVPLRPGDR